VYASLEWLKESQVIDDADTAVFEKVKQCRNDFAHEIATVLMGELPARFAEMMALLNKIEKWWIINVDIATDPQRVRRNEPSPSTITWSRHSR
jgi:hypothetical protein